MGVRMRVQACLYTPLFAAARCSLFGRTFSPKVVGSIPTRPIENCLHGRTESRNTATRGLCDNACARKTLRGRRRGSEFLLFDCHTGPECVRTRRVAASVALPPTFRKEETMSKLSALIARLRATLKL